jgi:LmbE family N-acetylglucosaminyl deacetylase/CheY-like chemotaxis protein
VREEGSRPDEPPGARGALAGRHVLVVEDDAVHGALVRRALAGAGADVRIAADVASAMAIIDGEHALDGLICDIGLPDVSGIWVAEAARARFPDAAIVMLTGHKSFDRAVEAIRAGADDYLNKPVSPDVLVAIVRRNLQRRARRQPEHVLAVGAHPDDVEIGCGGILARHVAAGDEVTILTLSPGAQGGEPALRTEESRTAAELLGADLVLADLADTAMTPGAETISPIAEAIDRAGATVVYTHTGKDLHQDHRAVHAASLVAAREIPRLFAYQAPSTSVEFIPSRFIDIEDHLPTKLALIACYGTQRDRPYLDEELLRATARYWARFARGTRYVEALEVIRDAGPVSRSAVAVAPASRADAR